MDRPDHARHTPSRTAALAVLALLATACISTSDTAAADIATPMPTTSPTAGQADQWMVDATVTTVNANGAWSWFEEERVAFDGPCRLLVGSVSDDNDPATAGGHPSDPVPSPGGDIEVATLDLATGRRTVDRLDTDPTYADDHNSAVLLPRPDGTVLAAWAGHMVDGDLHVADRSPDGTWTHTHSLPTTDGTHTSYANLVALPATGETWLFTRAQVISPTAWRSTDGGSTWTQAGTVVRMPRHDHPIGEHRPYMRYTGDGHDTIHFLATEGHPDEHRSTAIYHGMIRNGRVLDSHGVDLGPLDGTVDPRQLTPVAVPGTDQRLWHNDLELDPATGQPVALFARRTGNERDLDSYELTYQQARFDGTRWTVEDVGDAGTWMAWPAVYEADYAGLGTIDPSNPDRVVLSANVHPDTGQPTRSTADGQRHFELWTSTRQPDGTWAATPFTTNSTVDQFRPTIPRPVAGSPDAITWFAGTYRKFHDYDTDVMVAHTRPDGPCNTPLPHHTVPDGDTATVDTLQAATPTGAAVATSQLTWPDGTADLAVVTSDAVFADGLAATVLASHGPLLLTDPDHLTAATLDELVRAVGRGGTVVVVGGPAAISPTVVDTLDRFGMVPIRLAGPTRTGTAAAVARWAATNLQVDLDEALLARADAADDDPTAAWADAIAAAGLAATGIPLLLTPTATLDADTAAVITDLGIGHVTALGGPAAISDAVLADIASRDVTTSRLAGDGRSGTAQAVAGRFDTAPLAATIDGTRPDGWAWGLAAATLRSPITYPDTSGQPLGRPAGGQPGHCPDRLLIGPVLGRPPRAC